VPTHPRIRSRRPEHARAAVQCSTRALPLAVLLAMGAPLLVGCDAEPAPARTWETRLDAEHIGSECTSGRPPLWRPLHPGDAGAPGDPHPGPGIGFWQKPGTTCRFDLAVPAGARIALELRGAEARGPRRENARVSIGVVAGGVPRVLLEREVVAGAATAVEPSDLEDLDSSAEAIELRHHGPASAVPVVWADVTLRATTASPDAPDGWTRSFTDAVQAFAAETGWPAPDVTRRRLLVVGVDGASGPLLEGLIARGDTPNLARLARRGRRGLLESTFIPESAMAWTSLRTGVTAGVHGVLHFLSPDWKRSSYWKWLGDAGLRSIVVGVPKSDPEEDFEGLLVGGWNLEATARYTHPATLADHLAGTGYDPALAEEADPVVFARRMRMRTDLALALLETLEWDHAFVVYEYPDTAGHRFGLETERWRATYRAFDRELGRLLAVVDARTTVLVVSDHGWRRFPRAFAVGPWLAAEGFSHWKTQIHGGDRIAVVPARPFHTRPTPEERARLRDALLDVQDPGTGRSVVESVSSFAEAIPGPQSDRMPPGLLVDLASDYHAAGPYRGDASGNAPVWPAGPSEGHDRAGLYIVAGPGIAPGAGPDASVLDIAPTVSAFFQAPAPGDLAGRPLIGSASPEVVTERPDGGRPTAQRPGPAQPSEALRERLRALGYVDEAAPATAPPSDGGR